MQLNLLLLLSSTKATTATKVTKVNKTTKVILLFLLVSFSTVTLSDDSSEIPSVNFNLQLGDLSVKTELSSLKNGSSGKTEASDSKESVEGFREPSQLSNVNSVSSELAGWKEKRILEKMAASKTWEEMKNAWMSSEFGGKTGAADDLEFSPEGRFNFSEEMLTISQPPENITKDDNKVIGLEERLYPATMMACTQKMVKGKLSLKDMEQWYKLLFIRLFSYLKGDNAKKKRLEMTAPVFALTHLDSSYMPDKIAMCLWLTQDVESLVPEPLPSSPVFLWKMEPSKFLVRRFAGPGGEAQQEAWSKEAERLAENLKNLGLMEKTDRSMIFFSSYQAPWQRQNRRDEVLLRVKEGSTDWQSPFNSK